MILLKEEVSMAEKLFNCPVEAFLTIVGGKYKSIGATENGI